MTGVCWIHSLLEKAALYLLVESESELLEYLVSTSTFRAGHGKVLIHPRNPTTIKPTINTYGLMQPQCNMMGKLSLNTHQKSLRRSSKANTILPSSTLHACNIVIKVRKKTQEDPSPSQISCVTIK